MMLTMMENTFILHFPFLVEMVVDELLYIVVKLDFAFAVFKRSNEFSCDFNTEAFKDSALLFDSSIRKHASFCLCIINVFALNFAFYLWVV